MDNFMLDDIFNKFNYIPEKDVPNGQIGVNHGLELCNIPYLGQYGNDYEWLTPSMAIKCQPRNRDEQRKLIYGLMPLEYIEWVDNKNNQNQRRNLLADDTEFYVINYNATEFCTKRMQEYGDKSVMARINLAAHGYVYQDAQVGDEMKDNVLEVVYTSAASQDNTCRIENAAALVGIEECVHDCGKMNLNRHNFLHQHNIVEVHLHPSDDGAMAISPNNACFLMNMSLPIITFVINIKQIGGNHTSNVTSVFLVNVINQEASLCPKLTKVLNSFSAINYLEHLSDIASKSQDQLLKSPYKDPHNKAVFELRQKYFMDNAQCIVEMIKEYAKYLSNRISELPKQEKSNEKGEEVKKAFKFNSLLKHFALPYEGQLTDCILKKQAELLGHMIWFKFGQPDIPDFGSKYLADVEKNMDKEGSGGDSQNEEMKNDNEQINQELWKQRRHAIDIVLQMKKKTLKSYTDIIALQGSVLGFDDLCLNQIQECNAEINGVKLPAMVQEDAIESPILASLQQHLQDLFTNGENNQVMESSLDNLSIKAVKDLICFNMWHRKGRVEGVHPDFGRLSYIRSNKISGHYHATDDERVEMILEMTERLNNTD